MKRTLFQARKRAVTIHISNKQEVRLEGASLTVEQVSKDFLLGYAIAYTFICNAPYQVCLKIRHTAVETDATYIGSGVGTQFSCFVKYVYAPIGASLFSFHLIMSSIPESELCSCFRTGFSRDSMLQFLKMKSSGILHSQTGET